MTDKEALKELKDLYDISKQKKEVSQTLKIYQMIRTLSRNIARKGNE